MRYLVLFIAIYLIIKSVRRLLSNFKIVDADSDEIKGENSETQQRLRVNEADIEDADFKDVE